MSDFTIDFTNKDYMSLVTSADLYAKELVPEWTSRDDNDLNWATLKTVAYLISVGMFYIDLGVNEQDPYEVQIYRNALKLARRYGYLPLRATGAVGCAEVTVVTHDTLMTIPRGETTFTETATGKSYVLVEDAIFAPSVVFAPVTLQYGNWDKYQIGVSDGSAFQVFVDTTPNVQHKAIRVFVNEGLGTIEWSVKDTLLMSSGTDEHVRLVLNEDEFYEVHFGDNKSGKIPLIDSPIVFEVIALPEGSNSLNLGNLASGNISVCSNNSIASVSQGSAMLGGCVSETAAEIGRTLPQWMTTVEKCVGLADYAFLAKRVPGVAAAQAIGTGFNVYVYITPVDGGVPNNALLAKVYDYLSPRTLDQIQLHMVRPSQVGIYSSVSIVVEDASVREVVRANVAIALASYFNNPGGVGYAVTVLETYSRIKSVMGVKSAIVSALNTLGTGIVDVELSLTQVAISSLVTVSATGGIL
jgi:hypothetical protein